jgi:hypothetical protein
VLRETFPDQFGKHSTVQSFLAQAGSCVLSMTKSAVTHVTGMGGGNSKPSSSVDGSIQGQDNDAEAEARLKDINRELDQLQQQRKRAQANDVFGMQPAEATSSSPKQAEAPPPPPPPAAVTERPSLSNIFVDPAAQAKAAALAASCKEIDQAAQDAKKAKEAAAAEEEAASWERAMTCPGNGTLVRATDPRSGEQFTGKMLHPPARSDGNPGNCFKIVDDAGKELFRSTGWGKAEGHASPFYVKKNASK